MSSAARIRAPRALAWGGIAAVAYLIVAAVSFRAGLLPVRPLYEGTAPPAPYRWITPPPELAAANVAPEPGRAEIKLTAKGSEAGNVFTGDGQATLVFPQDGVKPKGGEQSIRVEITPLDPATLGSPPDGLRYDSNAYQMAASYARSGAPAQLATQTCPADQPGKCATVVLRYARQATEILRRDGDAWTKLRATPSGASLQIFADTPTLGTFVAAGPQAPGAAGGGSSIGTYLGIGLGVAAAVGAAAASRLRSVRRWRRRRRKQKAKAGARPSGPPPKTKKPGKTSGKKKR